MGSPTSLFSWKSGSATKYPIPGLKSHEGIDGVSCEAFDKDGTLWVGITVAGPGLGLQQLVQGVLKPFNTPQLRGESLEVLSLLVDHNDNLWVGTVSQGIYRIHGTSVDHFQSKDGLSSDLVDQFYEDREGTIWATTAKGMDSFHDLSITSFSTREGLSADAVDTVLASSDGAVWLGNVQNIDVVKNGSITSIGAAQGFRRNQVTSLFQDHAGRMWIGADNSLSIYQDGKFTSVKRPDDTPIGVIVGITEDTDRTIWVETIGPPRTLLHIRDTKVLEMFPAPQTPSARKVAADPSKGVWLGLMNGNLMRLQDGNKLLVDFHHDSTPEVNQLIVKPDGSVLGATTIGLVGWKNGRQQMLTARNGLPCNNFYALISDKQNALWLYTECGVMEIANVEIERWWEHPDATLQFRLFDSADGAQPGFAHFNGAAMTPDGKIWFASGTLLQMIDTANLHRNVTPPLVHVETMVADHKSYLPEQGLQLPPLTRDLEIDYTALSFVVPRKVKFRYILEGHDAGWSSCFPFSLLVIPSFVSLLHVVLLLFQDSFVIFSVFL
ncbi:MAG TPA: two-component regulator propeller domain-containing protein, partial [Terriglobales bacterium]|nr:two-component regulator propeller domain-containing protein [Terriglobales bacterium]